MTPLNSRGHLATPICPLNATQREEQQKQWGNSAWGWEKGPFVRRQRQDPTCSLSHTDKGGGGTLISSVFFLFFSPKVCSTKSLPGKLSARRKHPARSSPAWVISNISYCKPDTAREAAVKGNSRGEVWELTMWANNKYSCHFNHCTKFPTMSSICHAAEPLWDARGTHGSHWGSWGELKLK